MAVDKLGDLFERLADKAAKLPSRDDRHLLPARHPIQDFFVADLLDWALKNDMHSMEYPLFSLSKKPDITERHYDYGGIRVTITPSIKGIATIWDKDILIYAISQLAEALNRGLIISRTVRLKAYDLLVATNRNTGGEHYKRLEAAFQRLAGTRIMTNIATNGTRIREGFGLIDNWRIIERSPSSSRMIAVEVILNEWLFNAVLAREILTLNHDYFRLDSGLERRLYELARKHCGRQPKWTIGLALLHRKSGSHATIIKFREMLKRAVNANCLPDYQMIYDSHLDQVSFTYRNS